MAKPSKRLSKRCVVCGKGMRVFHYADGAYRGGHYFGEIPLYSKKEMGKAAKSGTHKVKIGGWTMDVMNYDPKPYGHTEYWECPKCYWRK